MGFFEINIQRNNYWKITLFEIFLCFSIDFRNPDVGKPDNLKNSAVLRMLEEEESRQRNGYGSGK